MDGMGQVDNDLRMYILSRPKDAVPPAVRQLLMPEGDAQWPGGNTASDNRIPFYPLKAKDGAGLAFWEADIQPLDPAGLVRGPLFPPPPLVPGLRSRIIRMDECGRRPAARGAVKKQPACLSP